MPPKLRQRTSAVKPQTYTITPQKLYISESSSEDEEENSQSTDAKPPIFTIDLSQPPSTRYHEVASHFQHLIKQLPPLFDEIVSSVGIPLWLAHFSAWLFLRRLYSKEQTAELKGLSKTFKVPLYLLIAYNVFLDLLMGCTSGGVITQTANPPTMMHFRSLDWGMPLLRQGIVQLDYVDGPGKKKIATSIGYVGYVGILTGVKKGLSMSLNFRPYHNARGWSWENVKFYAHLLLVLVGWRPSISAVMRDFLIPGEERGAWFANKTKHVDYPRRPRYSEGDIMHVLPTFPTTAAYLIFCTKNRAVVLEKDWRRANLLVSPSFLSVTNHDIAFESDDPANSATSHMHSQTHHFGLGMQDLIDESVERKLHLSAKWEEWSEARNARKGQGKVASRDAVTVEELKEWMLDYPIANEETHFTCLLNPAKARVEWVRVFEEGEIVGEDDKDEDDEEV